MKTTTVNIRNAMLMLIEANIVLFKCILNSDNRRSLPGVDSRAMSRPTWRRAPETDWACGTTLSEEIFLAEKNISCGEKYISCGEKYFLRKKIFLEEKIYFLRRKIYFLRKKYISCGKNIFLAEKIYFLRRKIFLAEKKYISCGEK